MNTIKERLGKAEQILMNYGISQNDAPAAVQAAARALLDRDVYDFTLDDRQMICSAMRDAIRLTGNGGADEGNPLVDLVYMPGEEKVRPVFANGAGRNGYYDINVAGDSGTAMISDITNQFIRKMW